MAAFQWTNSTWFSIKYKLRLKKQLSIKYVIKHTTSCWQHSDGRNRHRSMLSTNEAAERVAHQVRNAIDHKSMAAS
jgi:hypothetical protein